MDFLRTLKLEAINDGVSTGTKWIETKGETIDSFSPVDGKKIGSVTCADKAGYETVMVKAAEAFKSWRMVPAPTDNSRYLKRPKVLRKLLSISTINICWEHKPYGRIRSYFIPRSHHRFTSCLNNNLPRYPRHGVGHQARCQC